MNGTVSADPRHGPREEGDPRLLAEGWARRFVADAQRAQEALELFTGMGYEVFLDPVGPADLHEDCEHCRLARLLGFKTVYVRKPSRR